MEGWIVFFDPRYCCSATAFATTGDRTWREETGRLFSKWQDPCRIAAGGNAPNDAGTTYSGMFERMPRKRGLAHHPHAAFAKASAGRCHSPAKNWPRRVG